MECPLSKVSFCLSQITKKNAEIKRLKSTIKGVVNLAEDRNRRVKVDAHNQQMQDNQNHESKVGKLQEEIALLTKKLQDMTAENREKEQNLRKVQYTGRGPQEKVASGSIRVVG